MKQAMLENLIKNIQKLLEIGYKEENKENVDRMIRYMCIAAFQLNIPLNLVGFLRNHSNCKVVENIKLNNFDKFVDQVIRISKDIEKISMSYEDIKKELLKDIIVL